MCSISCDFSVHGSPGVRAQRDLGAVVAKQVVKSLVPHVINGCTKVFRGVIGARPDKITRDLNISPVQVPLYDWKRSADIIRRVDQLERAHQRAQQLIKRGQATKDDAIGINAFSDMLLTSIVTLMYFMKEYSRFLDSSNRIRAGRLCPDQVPPSFLADLLTNLTGSSLAPNGLKLAWDPLDPKQLAKYYSDSLRIEYASDILVREVVLHLPILPLHEENLLLTIFPLPTLVAPGKICSLDIEPMTIVLNPASRAISAVDPSFLHECTSSSICQVPPV